MPKWQLKEISNISELMRNFYSSGTKQARGPRPSVWHACFLRSVLEFFSMSFFLWVKNSLMLKHIFCSLIITYRTVLKINYENIIWSNRINIITFKTQYKNIKINMFEQKKIQWNKSKIDILVWKLNLTKINLMYNIRATSLFELPIKTKKKIFKANPLFPLWPNFHFNCSYFIQRLAKKTFTFKTHQSGLLLFTDFPVYPLSFHSTDN